MSALLFTRVANTLLREDVGGCVSRADHVTRDDGRWLVLGGTVELPVSASEHMQSWCFDETREARVAGHPVKEALALVAALQPATNDEERVCLEDFARELKTADAHAEVCDVVRKRLFAVGTGSGLTGACPLPVGPRVGSGACAPPAQADPRQEQTEGRPSHPETWSQSMLRNERYAAFLDHPFYPTARAKVGFGPEDLTRFAPEFQPDFELRWIAVPRAQMQLSAAAPPPFWPTFAQLELPPALEATHTLVPVHPHTWTGLFDLPELATLLSESHPSPVARVRVTPTLSVRTVAVVEDPRWHVKLPLRIRTLGMRNLRTIKPSTLGDGHRIQTYLGERLLREPTLAGHVLLTDESRGGAAVGQTLLGYLVRHYPEALVDETLVSVAGLSAPTPDGRLVAQRLADDFYAGSLTRFLDAYATLTLALHLRLWVRHGVALESNQQNTMLVLSRRQPTLRLLLKDNDAPRLWPERLARHPGGAALAEALEDRRILCDDEDSLAWMFLTITLQLNLSALVEALCEHGLLPRAEGYALVQARAREALDVLEAEGEDVASARRWLLDAPLHPVKYLLTAATLRPKALTGAADVNKFYGLTGPNPLRRARA